MRAEQHQPCGALSWRRRRTHGCRKQLRVSGCHKQLRRSQLVRAVSPMSTTRLGCGGQARARSGCACTVQRERARPAATPASGTSSHAREQPHARFVDAWDRAVCDGRRTDAWLEARGGHSSACPIEPSARSAWRVALMRAEQRPSHAAACELAHASPHSPPTLPPQPSPHHPANPVPLTVGKGGGAERVARARSPLRMRSSRAFAQRGERL